MAEIIMSLTGVDQKTAEEVLLKYETVEDAVDSLFVKPAVAGDKYLPPKPKVDTGLSEEQRALCERGRWLQDKVNVVFSVAHSKIRTQQDPSDPAASQPVQTSPEAETVVVPTTE